MGIELNTSESELRNKIDRLMNDIKLSLAKYHIDNEVKKQIDEMGDYAHELHMSLQNRDCKPKHHAYMKKIGKWKRMTHSSTSMYIQLKIC